MQKVGRWHKTLIHKTKTELFSYPLFQQKYLNHTAIENTSGFMTLRRKTALNDISIHFISLYMFQYKKDIFFDLDHTIWDFDRNAQETLHELYYVYKFDTLFNRANSDEFIETYTINNHRVWELYHHGKIDKPTLRKLRFADTFTQLGVDPALFPVGFEEEYLKICPTKTNLFPHAIETLEYLQNRYNLHLISNGFKEACEAKLTHSDLRKYFKTIVISEVFGVNKPDPRIFDYAVNNGEASKENSIMIGDNIDADVRGALNAGLDAIYFNVVGTDKPQDIPHMIVDLKELQDIF
jgi:YjjG family noncanonical pyrimidine nucleotidase